MVQNAGNKNTMALGPYY